MKALTPALAWRANANRRILQLRYAVSGARFDTEWEAETVTFDFEHCKKSYNSLKTCAFQNTHLYLLPVMRSKAKLTHTHTE